MTYRTLKSIQGTGVLSMQRLAWSRPKCDSPDVTSSRFFVSCMTCRRNVSGKLQKSVSGLEKREKEREESR